MIRCSGVPILAGTVMSTPEGQVAVAIITTPGSGAFADATAMATTIAQSLGTVEGLPAANCG